MAEETIWIGGPKARALVAAGLAEPAAQPPEDVGRVPELRDSAFSASRNRDADPRPEMQPGGRPIAVSAQADALIAALSRRVRRRRH